MLVKDWLSVVGKALNKVNNRIFLKKSTKLVDFFSVLVYNSIVN